MNVTNPFLTRRNFLKISWDKQSRNPGWPEEESHADEFFNDGVETSCLEVCEDGSFMGTI